jgi:hypothetical protein
VAAGVALVVATRAASAVVVVASVAARVASVVAPAVLVAARVAPVVVAVDEAVETNCYVRLSYLRH